MRKIIALTLFVICYISGIAQRTAPNNLPSPNSTGYSKIGFVRGDSAILMGIRTDTNWRPIVPALSAVRFGGGDSAKLFYHDGKKWSEAGKVNKVDSVTTANDSLYYWINGTRTFVTNIAVAATGGDTTILQAPIDSTGQLQGRMLFSRPGFKIGSSPRILVDSANSKLVINNPNVSIGGPGMQLYVLGNATIAGFARIGTMELYGISTPVTDTTTYKPLAIDVIGNVRKLDRWPGSGGGGVDSFYFQFRKLNDTTLVWDRGDRVDTLAISATGGGGGGSGMYVDTIYRKAGQDSIFYTINGGPERAIKDSTGGAFPTIGNGLKLDGGVLRWADTLGFTILTTLNENGFVLNNNTTYGDLWRSAINLNEGGFAIGSFSDPLNKNNFISFTANDDFMSIFASDSLKLLKQTLVPYSPTTTFLNKYKVVLMDSTTGALVTTSPANVGADTTGTGNLYIRNQFAGKENKKFSIVQGKVDALDFNTTSSIADSTQRLTWDDGNGTLNIGLKGGHVNLAVGQEQVARVFNDQGSPLVDGDIVYITGAQGNRVKVKKATSTVPSIAYATIGMVTEAIGTGAEGFITILGTVNRLATDTLAEGAELWLDSVAGRYTDVKPSAPLTAVSIGHVERSHATVGSIYVNIRPEIPVVASYGKNATRDSTILLLTNGQRFAARDSVGGGGGIPIDSVAIRRYGWTHANNFRTYDAGGLSNAAVASSGSTITAKDSVNFLFGFEAGNTLSSGYRNLFWGTRAGNRATTAYNNIGIGARAYAGNTGTTATGYSNIAIGQAFNVAGNSPLGQITTGHSNVAIGSTHTAFSPAAGANMTTGTFNTFIGGSAGGSMQTGLVNTAVGALALRDNISGQSNTAVGYQALLLTTSSFNTVVGESSASNNTTGSVTAFGYFSASMNTTGLRNFALGEQAMGNPGGSGTNLTGNDNVALGQNSFATTAASLGNLAHNRNVTIGNNSGRTHSTAINNNTLIGFASGGGTGTSTSDAVTGSNNIAIGAVARLLSLSGSDQIVIGSSTDGSNPYRALISDVSGSHRRWTLNGTTTDVTANTASVTLDITGTLGGVRFPRLTTTQRDALTATEGLVIFNTTTKKLQVHDGTNWVDLH